MVITTTFEKKRQLVYIKIAVRCGLKNPSLRKKTPIFCPNGSSIHKVYFSKTSVNKCLTYDFRKNALLEWKLNFNQFEQFFKIFSPKNSPIYRKIRRNKSFNQKSVSFPKMTNDFRKNYFRGKMQFGPYNFSKNY